MLLVVIYRILLNNNVVKVSYKVREEDRGRIDFQVAMVKYNTEMRHIDYVVIPYNNLDLDIVLHTERNKMLPGEQDTWSVTVKNYKGKPVKVPVMATMYDAALDKFSLLNWDVYQKPGVTIGSFINTDSSFDTQMKYQYYRIALFHYSENMTLSAVNLLPNRYNYGIKAAAADRNNLYYFAEEEITEEEVFCRAYSHDVIHLLDKKPYAPKEIQPAKIRKDFNETAFFYPDLRTDKNGDVSFTFTIPDALTRWNLKLLAHSKDLKVGQFETSVVTQQPLMIMPPLCRR